MVAVALAIYLLFSATAWLLGHREFLRGDFFRFSLIICLAYFPFLGFITIIRTVGRRAIVQTQSPPPDR